MARTMTKLLTTLTASLAVAGTIAAYAPAANAQEVQLTGPLKGAPAVRRLRLYREGRFEIAPVATFTLLDEYNRTILFGLRANYGITDWLSIGAWGGFGAIQSPTGLTSQIDSNAPRRGLPLGNVSGDAGAGTFQKSVAQIQYVAMLQLQAIPFRGKFALFQSLFGDVDFYLMAGGGVVGTQERQDCSGFVACATQGGGSAATPANTTDPTRTGGSAFPLQSQTKFAPTWGLGFNFYINKFISVGLEWRMIPFAWNRSGFDTRGATDAIGTSGSNGKFPDNNVDSHDSTYRFNQMASISVGFTFPTAPKSTD